MVSPAVAFNAPSEHVASSGIGSSRVRQRANSTISLATRSISALYKCIRSPSRQSGEARVEVIFDIGRKAAPGIEALTGCVVGEKDRAVGQLYRVTTELAQLITNPDHGRDVLHRCVDAVGVG